MKCNIVKNMVVSFQPNVPKNCSSEKIPESTLACFQEGNPNSQNLYERMWDRLEVKIMFEKIPNTNRETYTRVGGSTISEFL